MSNMTGRWWWVPFAIVLAVSLPAPGQDPRFSNKLAPYVASPQRVVDRMLEVAQLKPGETLYDLGCGDGRVLVTAVERYRARAVGVEISGKLVRSANDLISRLGIQNEARVVHGDLLDVDFSAADVVTIYLQPQANEKLRPRMESLLKPGARVVSFAFPVPGWKPKLVDTSDDRRHVIYLYQMPPLKK